MRIPPRARLSLLVGGVALLALLAGTGGAAAHALLARADPPINATLRESPTAVNLFMTEPLQRDFSAARVLDSAGQRVDLADATVNPDDATNISVHVRRLPPGIYTVVWETLSRVDGHTWTGSYAFTVLNPDGSAPAGVAFRPDLSRPGPPAGQDAAIKWVTFVALFALLGAGLLGAVVLPPALPFLGPARAAAERRCGRLLWDVLGVAVALLLAATVVDAVSAALKLGGLAYLDEAIFQTRNGGWLLARWSFVVLAAAITGLAWRRPALRRDRRSFALIALTALAIVATLANVSHGAAQDQGSIWATLFDAAHLAAVAAWIGALALLLLAFWVLRSAGEPAARRRFQVEAVRRFSWIAGGAVPVLATAGLLSALAQVPAWRGLTDTDWGIALLVKLGLLAVLFAVAAGNALALRPRTEHQAAAGAVDAVLLRRFGWLMRAEVGLGLAVLAATAALTQVPSPRSALPELLAGEQKDRTITEALVLDDLRGTITVSPNLVGVNRYTVTLIAESGGPPLDPIRDVRLRFRYADPAVGPVTIPADASAEGAYVLEGAFFGLAGDWTIEVEVRRQTRDDAVASVATTVEQGFVSALPFPTDQAGALALPISQFDWNGIGALWAAVGAGLLIAFRPALRRHASPSAADGALVGGALFMAVAVVLLFGVHVTPGRTLRNPVERTEASVAAGAVGFAANCAQCHGAQGDGAGPLAATLPAPPANFRVHVPFHPDGVIFSWISGGIRGRGMPAFADRLTEQERWDLVNYLRANFDRPLAAPAGS